MAITAVYSDIDIELTQATDGDVLRKINEEAITNSLMNIVSTLQGSRRMLYSFAASNQKVLFENINKKTASVLEYRLLEGINKWDDRVIIENVNIQPVYDRNLYKCLLSFKVRGYEYKGIKTVRFILKG